MAGRLALLTSLVMHAAALVWLFLGEPARGTTTTVAIGVLGRAPAGARPDVVLPPLGPADHLARWPSSPWPRAAVVDAPDRRAASRGGGAEGGSESWTGREDREELRAQPWNDPARYRLPRQRTAAERVTTEARARTPRAGFDASYRSRLPRRHGPGPSGTVDPRSARPLVAQGPTATDANRAAPFDQKVRPRDDAEAAQASDERHPQPFDLGRPRSGGPHDGAGVTGPVVDDDDGHARHDGDGAGGSPLDVARGSGQPSTRARMQDDYFRRLHARVLERVRWPRALAVELEQGEVVVSFTLRRDGSVAEVRVARPSGFVDLDDAVVTAIRAASPFGPVPATLVVGRGDLRVNTPFLFENPLIR